MIFQIWRAHVGLTKVHPILPGQTYLGCNVSAILFKPIKEICVDVVSILSFLDFYELHSRMIKRQNILVAVFRQIRWLTGKRKTLVCKRSSIPDNQGILATTTEAPRSEHGLPLRDPQEVV